jgi:hypothetical protein
VIPGEQVLFPASCRVFCLVLLGSYPGGCKYVGVAPRSANHRMMYFVGLRDRV